MTHSFKVHQFHLVWSTKNRRNLIKKSFQKPLYDYMGGIVKEHKGQTIYPNSGSTSCTYEDAFIGFLNAHHIPFDPPFVFD